MLGCTTNNISGTPIDTVLIGQGELYGNGQEDIPEQKAVIRDSETWNELLQKMNSVNGVSDSFTETDIDFTKYMVVAVFDKVENTGGYSIQIEKVLDVGKEIKVIIYKTSPGGFTTQVITQPFHIVKIPASSKRVIFE